MTDTPPIVEMARAVLLIAEGSSGLTPEDESDCRDFREALRTLAFREPELFREILDFSRSLYEHERRTYHVSAELERVPAGTDLADDELPPLFEDDDARQVLHVTFGRVLTEKKDDGGFLFKGRLLAALSDHEAEHYDNLVAHFRRHTVSFGGAGGEKP